MLAPKLKQALYIDALALVPDKKSGVGVTLQQTLAHLVQNIGKEWTIYLVVPLWKARYLQAYTAENVQIKTLFLPARVIAILMRLRLLPPIDWFLGRGVYVFFNYRNWPLWRSRSLTYIYDVSFIAHPETVQVRNQKYLSQGVMRWAHRSDQVITISEQVKAELEKHLSLHYEKINVVYCGVDTAVFKPQDKRTIAAAKQRYDIPFEQYMLFVGNIEPRKNLTALIKAYESLPAELQATHGLVFVGGDGWLNDDFYEELALAQRKGLQAMKVKKFVSDSDLPALYSGASLLVHPAIYEGFGITPLEAMACGTPVAVSKLPAITEVVQDAGQYFDPRQPADIAKAMHAVLVDDALQQRLIEKGAQRAKALSWAKSAEALQAVIEQEYAKGSHRHPLLKRLKTLYQRADRAVRKLFGDRILAAYRPQHAEGSKDLRRTIYDDFLREQPMPLQSGGLKAYLGLKHLAASTLKALYRGIRRLA